MEIRYLTDHPEFIPTLASWFHAQWGYLSPGSTVQTTAEKLKSHLHCDELPLALIAFGGIEIIGTASLRFQDMHTKKELSPWLASVYVPVEHRNKGIGTRLVIAIEEKARELGHEALYLWTDDKEGFYAKLGWVVLDRVNYLGEQVVVMRKHLGSQAA